MRAASAQPGGRLKPVVPQPTVPRQPNGRVDANGVRLKAPPVPSFSNGMLPRPSTGSQLPPRPSTGGLTHLQHGRPGVPRMIDLYDSGEMIHRSTIGTELMVGIHKLTDEAVVIKAIDRSQVNRRLLGPALEKYAKLRHPHICQLYESFDAQQRVLLVLEFVEGMALSEYMVHVGCTHEEAQQIVRQACAALRYAHREGVCHRDLRLENIMLQRGDRCCVKVVDWAMCGAVGRPLTRRLAPSPYCPPEALEAGEYDGTKLDVWALGVVLHVLLTGRFPFEEEHAQRGASGDELPLDGVPEEAQPLLRAMLAFDPAQRPPIDQLCAHPWLHVPEEVALADEDAVDEDVLQELEELGLPPHEVAESVRRRLHDANSTAYKLLRHKKERALDALPAPEPEPELAAAPPKTREAFATQLGAEAQAGVGLAGEEAAAA